MSEHLVAFGPCIVPTVPYDHFTRVPDGIDRHDVWRIIGPTVQRNINAPLWSQFCAVYLEGMNHALGVLRDESSAGAKP